MNISLSFFCKDAVDIWVVIGTIITFSGTVVALFGVISNSCALKKQRNYEVLEKRMDVYTYFHNCLFFGKPADIEHISYLKFLFSSSLFNNYFRLKNLVETEGEIVEIRKQKQLLIMSIAREDKGKALSIDEQFVKILRDNPSIPQFAEFRRSCRDLCDLEIDENEIAQFKELFENYIKSKKEFDEVESEIHTWLTRMHNEIYKGMR